jgi:hypothetical protein
MVVLFYKSSRNLFQLQSIISFSLVPLNLSQYLLNVVVSAHHSTAVFPLLQAKNRIPFLISGDLIQVPFSRLSRIGAYAFIYKIF